MIKFIKKKLYKVLHINYIHIDLFTGQIDADKSVVLFQFKTCFVMVNFNANKCHGKNYGFS